MISDEEIERERRRLVGRCVEHLRRVMRQQGVNQKELARRLGSSPARVSVVLKGDRNLTLKTLASFAAALDHHLSFKVFDPPTPEGTAILCLGA